MVSLFVFLGIFIKLYSNIDTTNSYDCTYNYYSKRPNRRLQKVFNLSMIFDNNSGVSLVQKIEKKPFIC